MSVVLDNMVMKEVYVSPGFDEESDTSKLRMIVFSYNGREYEEEVMKKFGNEYKLKIIKNADYNDILLYLREGYDIIHYCFNTTNDGKLLIPFSGEYRPVSFNLMLDVGTVLCNDVKLVVLSGFNTHEQSLFMGYTYSCPIISWKEKKGPENVNEMAMFSNKFYSELIKKDISICDALSNANLSNHGISMAAITLNKF